MPVHEASMSKAHNDVTIWSGIINEDGEVRERKKSLHIRESSRKAAALVSFGHIMTAFFYPRFHSLDVDLHGRRSDEDQHHVEASLLGSHSHLEIGASRERRFHSKALTCVDEFLGAQ